MTTRQRVKTDHALLLTNQVNTCQIDSRHKLPQNMEAEPGLAPHALPVVRTIPGLQPGGLHGGIARPDWGQVEIGAVD